MPSRPDTGFFSSAKRFSPDVGQQLQPGAVRGYYIDFDFKAEAPSWPPDWLPPREEQLHVGITQWALGAYERYLKGEGEEWLAAARDAADYLVEEQESGGPRDGGWVHQMPMPHTFVLDPPWISAMAQGEGASLLVRMHAETGEERYAEAALRALRPFRVEVHEGGVLTQLDGGPFFEEYPTEKPSLVLNGGIFALWGAYDVGLALGSKEAEAEFEAGLDTLATNLDRWDTGFWSLYDLHPLPLRNVASSAYHLLHVRQLQAMKLIAPRPELDPTIERFEGYMENRFDRLRAFAQKAAFRLIVPRNRLLGRRLPWTRSRKR